MGGLTMTKLTATLMLLVGVAGLAVAGGPIATPEIDPATGVGAFALLVGAILVIRARKKDH
jgi:hypothetical protein